MSIVRYFHMHRFSDAIWLILFVAALFILCKKGRDDATKRKLFIFVIINILVVYCPLTAKLLVPAVFPGANEYERLSWTFFIIPITAYAIFSIVTEGQKKIIIVLVAIVLFLSTGRFSEAMFKKPENIYKIPDESIELVELLDKDAKERGLFDDDGARVGVAMQMSPMEVISDNMSYTASVYYGIRQYAGEYPLEMLDVNHDKAAERLDWTILDITKIESDYLILEDDEIFNETVPMIGFMKLDETENFVLYRKYNAK